MSFWTGLAGSILVPVAGAVLTRLSHEVDPIRDDQDLFFRLTLAHGAVGLGSYVWSQRASTDALHDFAIGGAAAEALLAGLAIYAGARENAREPEATIETRASAARMTSAPLSTFLLSGGARGINPFAAQLAPARTWDY